MNSVTDICKYHFLCFVTIIQVKVISGHQVKSKNRDLDGIKKKLGFRAAIHVFRSDFRKERKNDPNTLFEASESVKKIKFGKSGLSPEMR